jgi:hypothetical protein
VQQPSGVTGSVKRKAVPQHTYGGAGMYSSYSFTISALYGGEWSASRPGRALTRERTPGTHWTGDWVGLRAGLDTQVRGKVLFACVGDGTSIVQSSSP